MANKNYYKAVYVDNDGNQHSSAFSSLAAFENAVQVFDYKAIIKEKHTISKHKTTYYMWSVDKEQQFIIHLYRRSFNNGAFLIHF